ncbi:MAG: TonB-dependent receptor, partial [Prevotellaceae bacterium]|nr:TonB-dependent receptor [Prevotellaceae bacterium]
MTARLLPLVLLVAAGVTGVARQRVVTGTVVSKKDRQPLELATARLVLRSDTTRLVAGAVTDSLGRFRLVTEQTAPMRLRVGFVGLTSAGQDLQFPDAETDSVDVGTIQLDGTDMALRAAVVRAVAARVEQQGDTTVFNASAFRTAEGATLEALIKQLPGAEVSDDGTIKINGKTVKELLINGKDFFKGDTKVAMKNLPTNFVSRVKSYDKKSDYAEQTGVDDGEESFVLDISTKRELNQSFVSNTDVAGGVDDEGSALYSG